MNATATLSFPSLSVPSLPFPSRRAPGGSDYSDVAEHLGRLASRPADTAAAESYLGSSNRKPRRVLGDDEYVGFGVILGLILA